jgi:hypothetical protein
MDTEFIESGAGNPISLISIGILAEDGREFYGINWDCGFHLANGWVQENVLTRLPFRPPTAPAYEAKKLNHIWYRFDELRFAIADFIGCDRANHTIVFPETKEKPEFWTYYGDYDWVVFCQIFGSMMHLPKGFPMYARDIKQWCDQLGNPPLPAQGKGEHNALSDARWNRQAWEFLREYEMDCTVERL